MDYITEEGGCLPWSIGGVVDVYSPFGLMEAWVWFPGAVCARLHAGAGGSPAASPSIMVVL